MVSSSTTGVLILSLLLRTALAVDPLVRLDYAPYKGVALHNGITQWLGMRYARAPINDLRFAAPQDPVHYDDVQDASKNGKICLSTPGGHPGDIHDENCLFISVYAPSSADVDSKLPVYFFVQGGGFNTNSNANYNGSGLIEASGNDIIVVNFNYRVGPYGFLAAKEILDGSGSHGASINNGLKDQRKALRWVQKYIRQFGGDPDKVTLAGDSAGGASVSLQVTAYNGRDDKLWSATAAESQSFAAIRTVKESQYQYDYLVKSAGCDGKSDTLACLRGLSASALQDINHNIAPPGGQTGAPLYMYGPVLDHDFVTDSTYAAFTNGKFVKKPAIWGDDTNEGTIFVPKSTNTQEQSNQFIKDQFPTFTGAQLNTIAKLYPQAGTPQYPDSGSYWRQCSNAYGEIRYICPGIYLNGIYANNSVPGWNYHWNVIDPSEDAAGYGVKHTVEVNAIWGPQYTGGAPASYNPGQSNYPIVPVTQAYWTSFVKHHDPNTDRASGSPEWKQWTKTNSYARLLFQIGQTQMEIVPPDQQTRCGYVSSIALDLKQ